MKDKIKFPRYFPGVQHFTVADKKVYVLTFRQKNGQNEFIIFDIKGKFLKKAAAPVKEKDPEHLSPFTIKDGKFYQLVENEEEENWELHAYSFE